jgi:hypothetical protein
MGVYVVKKTGGQSVLLFKNLEGHLNWLNTENATLGNANSPRYCN